MINIPLLPTQHKMVNDWTHDRQLYISGYRGGKTFSMLAKIILNASLNLGRKSIVMEPTHQMLAMIVIPDLEEMLEDLEIPYTKRMSPFPQYWLEFENGIHEIRMLSAENHNRIRGFSAQAIFLDEFETIEKDLATEIFRKCVARLSEGPGFKFIAMYSTPDQKGFCYQHFVEEPAPNKILYQTSTTENFFLPDGYVETLLRDYPANLVDAYVKGLWVNLSDNRVYENYDRELNGSTRIVTEKDILHIGIDLNIRKMPATVFVIDNSDPIAVDEFFGSRDTQALIIAIKERYPKHKIILYPDSSSKAEKTNAASSDLAQFKKAFGNRQVISFTKNPLIQTRLNCVNSMILDGNGLRRFKVNAAKCPLLVKGLENQPYNKEGKPDKRHESDDTMDSMGYFLFAKYQVKRGSIRVYG